MSALQLIGPFTQIITMSGHDIKGPISDHKLEIITAGGIVTDHGLISKIGKFESLAQNLKSENVDIHSIDEPSVLLPGFIDAHTHICFNGSRAQDYALRNAGSSYLEIAKKGGGIWDTVQKTRKASLTALSEGILERSSRMLKRGITTIEVKSGYGLTVDEELKMLNAILLANQKSPADLISTCLAAHIFPKDFEGNIQEYLEMIINEVFPIIKSENLSNRIDAFIEDGAFSQSVIAPYLQAAKNFNFDITIHADQFSVGGSHSAVTYQAVSADHLEVSGDTEIEMIAKSNVIATALPGASIGLGVGFTPARKILNAGGALAIASDWNPGSAPMGDLLTAAAIIGTFEKLTSAEVFAGITFRAAGALRLTDRGILEPGKIADLVVFPTNDYREILYHQGQLLPSQTWKRGIQLQLE